MFWLVVVVHYPKNRREEVDDPVSLRADDAVKLNADEDVKLCSRRCRRAFRADESAGAFRSRCRPATSGRPRAANVMDAASYLSSIHAL